MYRFLIIIEQGKHNYSAYVPDLPGCITTGDTQEEVLKNMQEAIALHLRGMVEDHEPISRCPGASCLDLRWSHGHQYTALPARRRRLRRPGYRRLQRIPGPYQALRHRRNPQRLYGSRL